MTQNPTHREDDRPITVPGDDVLDGLDEPRQRDPRDRIRSSRYGTLVVLLITALLVGAGAWIVKRGNDANDATQSGTTTAVTIPGRSTVPPPEVGRPAADFTVTTVDGKRVSLSDYRGKPVWLTFGASWCAGCQAEVPDIQSTYEKVAPKGAVVLEVNITEDAAAAKAYATRVGLTYPITADPESQIADIYRVSAIPAHFFIDRTGVLREIRQGALDPETMTSVMTGLLSR